MVLKLIEFLNKNKEPIPESYKQQYLSEIERLNFRSSKIVSLLGLTLVPLFYLTGIDYFFFPEGHFYFLILRLFVAIICFTIYFLHKFEFSKRYSNLLSSLVFIIVGFSISIMIRFIGYDSPYYAGLNLIYLATILVPWEMKWAFSTCFIVYSSYLIPIIIFDIPNINVKIFISNNQFQIFTIIPALVANKFLLAIRKTEIINRLKIETQAEELKIKEEEKQEFISNITHDLKTPLSVISGHAEMLKLEISEDSKLAKYSNFIDDAAVKTTRLLDVLTSISNLESEKNKPHLQLYDFTSFITGYTEQFEVLAQKDNININLECPHNRLVIHTDIMWMERIVGNLVQNSFKFTPSGGTISIIMFLKTHYVFLEVSDTGCGIPKHKLPYIFDRKYQANEEKKKEGFGLGLSIVKEMIEILGGSIDVESEVDKGTTFRIKLTPYVDQNAPVKNSKFGGKDRRVGQERRETKGIEETKKAVEHDMQMKSLEIDISNYENKSPDKATILLVEDNQGQLHLLLESLKNHFNLIFASNGKEALVKLETFKNIVDLILSDVNMPEMNGLKLCKNVFEKEEYKHIPFIFITAYYNPDEQFKGLSYGATDYLQKPFNSRILLEKLNHWISRREYEKYLINITELLEHKNNNFSKLRAFVSHEVRNPLMVVSYAKQGLDKLKEKMYDITDEKDKALWDRISKLDDTMKTINNVLETSKVLEDEFNNTSEFKLIPVNLLLDEAIKQTEHLIHGVSLIHKIDAAPSEKISCDQRMLTQVFVNLIRNAVEAIRVKHSSGGTIEITYTKDIKNLQIKIKDNGIGMTKEQKDNLFTYKYTTKNDGTGVGLHLSQKMINVLGGSIAVFTEENSGSEFVVSLPLMQESPD